MRTALAYGGPSHGWSVVLEASTLGEQPVRASVSTVAGNKARRPMAGLEDGS